MLRLFYGIPSFFSGSRCDIVVDISTMKAPWAVGDLNAACDPSCSPSPTATQTNQIPPQQLSCSRQVAVSADLNCHDQTPSIVRTAPAHPTSKRRSPCDPPGSKRLSSSQGGPPAGAHPGRPLHSPSACAAVRGPADKCLQMWYLSVRGCEGLCGVKSFKMEGILQMLCFKGS